MKKRRCNNCYYSKPVVGIVYGTQVHCFLHNGLKLLDSHCPKWKRMLTGKEISQRRIKLEEQISKIEKSIEPEVEKLRKEIYNLRYQCKHENKQINYESWSCCNCGMSR